MKIDLQKNIMKKLFAVVGSLLLFTGIRAQTTPQTKKETRKPAATNSTPAKSVPVSPTANWFHKSPATVQKPSFVKNPAIKHH
ncbi:MAG TPA: hypothetical protein VGM30_03790 [Puia sp.]|jgi:hypothetical protein